MEHTACALRSARIIGELTARALRSTRISREHRRVCPRSSSTRSHETDSSVENDVTHSTCLARAHVLL